jgi:hypothetical protein
VTGEQGSIKLRQGSAIQENLCQQRNCSNSKIRGETEKKPGGGGVMRDTIFIITGDGAENSLP